MAVAAVEHVPEEFEGEWILSDQTAGQLRLDDWRGLVENRTEQAARASVGGDLHVCSGHAVVTTAGSASRELRVDVQHLELTLFICFDDGRTRYLKARDRTNLVHVAKIPGAARWLGIPSERMERGGLIGLGRSRSLEPALFQRPPAEYGPVAMWFLNTQLEDGELRRQIRRDGSRRGRRNPNATAAVSLLFGNISACANV